MPSGIDYLPTTDAARVLWMQNFATKFAAFAAPLGFGDNEIEVVSHDAVAIANVIARNEATKQYAKDVAAYKKSLIDGKIGGFTPNIPAPPITPAPANPVNIGIIARVRLLVNRIKASPTYSANIGQDLGVIASGDNPPDPATAQPILVVAVSGGRVEIKFVKGVYDGILLECKRGAEPDFVPLQAVLQSPFVDMRPKIAANGSEVRSYRALFLKKNVAVGQHSPVATVVLP